MYIVYSSRTIYYHISMRLEIYICLLDHHSASLVSSLEPGATAIFGLKDKRDATDLLPPPPSELKEISEDSEIFPQDVWERPWKRINKEVLKKHYANIKALEQHVVFMEEVFQRQILRYSHQEDQEMLRDACMRNKQAAKDMINEQKKEFEKLLEKADVIDKHVEM